MGIRRREPVLDIVTIRPSLDERHRGAHDVFQALFPHGAIRRVLLVSVPDGNAELFRYSTAKLRRYPNYPPYGLGLLAQHLRSIQVESRIVNLNHEVLVAAIESASEEEFDFDQVWRSRIDKAIAEFEPDLVGITCMFTMAHTSLKAACAHVKAAGLPVAIGGVHVTNDVERVLDDIPEADFAFIREADVSLKRFCQVVSGEEPANSLAQVIVRRGSERYHFLEESRPSETEMDVIPAYDLFSVNDLSSVGILGDFYHFMPPATPITTCLSNRGCRARCTFCSVRNFNGRLVRQRAVESVLDEIQLLHDQHGIRHIVWLDDDLLKDNERALRLFRGLTERELDLTWDATNGLIAASCKEEMVEAMEASGCIGARLGIESGTPEILRQIKKPGTVDVFMRAAEVFRRHPKIHISGFLMFGFPGETMRQIEDTLNLGLALGLDWYQLTPLQPLPNTPIYDSMVEQGLVSPVGSSELNFMRNAYGRLEKIQQQEDYTVAETFMDAFASIGPDEQPPQERASDIWFYMNYHLNYHRLYSETRPIKVRQMLQHLGSLASKLSPDHCLALYFIGYLQHRWSGSVEQGVADRLRAKLEASPFWSERFRAFGMTPEDLTRGVFPNEGVPRIRFALPVDSQETLATDLS
jgi:radical SAM superfamily enzyme YgiQ (UPF0313 family)